MLLVFLVALELVAVPGFALLLLGPGLSWGDVGLLLVASALDVGPGGGRHARLRAGRADPRAGADRADARPAAAGPRADRRRARAAPLFARAPAGGAPGTWLAVLGLYDLVFVLLAYAVFDFLLED